MAGQRKELLRGVASTESQPIKRCDAAGCPRFEKEPGMARANTRWGSSESAGINRRGGADERAAR